MGAIPYDAAVSRPPRLVTWCDHERERILSDLRNWVSIASIAALEDHADHVLASANHCSQLLQAAGAVDLSASMYLSAPLNWVGNVLGGALFGFGMVLAGGIRVTPPTVADPGLPRVVPAAAPAETQLPVLSFADIAEKVTPAVVGIQATEIIDQNEGPICEPVQRPECGSSWVDAG